MGDYRSYPKFLLLLFALTLLLLVLGIASTRRLGGEEAVTAMYWGCGLSFVASAMSGLPQVMRNRWPQANAGNLVLGSLAIRLGTTLLGILAILLSTEISKPAFLLWVVISYLILLIADVSFLLARSRAS